MTTKYVQQGEILDFTPGAAVTSNQVVQLGALLGVACADIAANATGALAITGVWDLPKKAGTAYAAGDKLTWSVSDGAFIKGAGVTGDTLGGAIAIAPAQSADVVARVILLPGTGAKV